MVDIKPNTDSNGIIGPDGKFITVKSQVQDAKDTSRATVIFDSGLFDSIF